MNNKTIIQIVIIGGLLIGGYFLYRMTLPQQKEASQTTQEASESTKSAQDLSAKPPSDYPEDVIPSVTEGPYYKTNTPEKNNLKVSGIPGEKLVLTGYVYTKDCKPIADAWLDFWQADGEGNYDNTGYKLRGHQVTDENGMYKLETVVPGEYPGRTPHIHVKVRASENSPIITSQLFLPGVAQNESDSIYDQSLLLKNVQDTPDGKTSNFNFVITN